MGGNTMKSKANSRNKGHLENVPEAFCSCSQGQKLNLPQILRSGRRKPSAPCYRKANCNTLVTELDTKEIFPRRKLVPVFKTMAVTKVRRITGTSA